MNVAIMQPYFFPYIGYWQLMNAVDLWVIYNDVNYIKGGWVNRNRIYSSNDKNRYINLPVLGASPNKCINEIKVNYETKQINHTLAVIQETYRGAPLFKDVFPIIREIFNSRTNDCASFIADSFRFLCAYLGIDTERVLSSELEKDTSLKGEDKVMNICELLKADRYINAIGGRSLYHKDHFRNRGIDLCFLQTDEIRYQQFDDMFQPNLSIIDVIMFNDRGAVKDMLNRYTLL